MKPFAAGVAGIVVAAGVALAASSLGACKGDATHIFSARRFDPVLTCLDRYAAVDVVSGDDTGIGCDLVCIASSEDTYVTRQCPPYPPLFKVSTSDAGDLDPTCARALATYARGDTCDGDAGVIHGDGGAPPDAGDAASPADSSAVDAASDVTTD